MGFLLIMIIAIIMVAIFRVPLLQKYGASVANQFGVEVVAFQLQELSYEQIAIPLLEARYKEEKIAAIISIKNLQIEFNDWTSLQVSIKNAAADEIIIELDTADYEQDSMEQEISVRRLLETVAVAEIDVKKISFNYRSDAQNEFLFQGSVEHSKHALKLAGDVQLGKLPVFVVSLNFDKSGDFNLTVLSDGRKSELVQLHGQLEIEDDWLLLDAKGEAGLTAINEVANALVTELPAEIEKDQTAVELIMEMDLQAGASELMNSMAASIEVDTSIQANFVDTEPRRLDVDARFKCTVAGLETVECLFRQPVYSKVHYSDVPPWVHEYFGWREKKYVVEINPADEIRLQLQMNNNAGIQLTGDLQAHARAQNAPFTAQIELSGFSAIQDSQLRQLQSEFAFKSEAREIVSPVNSARVIIEGRGSFKSDATHTDFHINRGAKIIAQQLSYQDVIANKIELAQQNGVNIQYGNNTGNISSKNLRYKILGIDANQQETAIHSADLTLDIAQLRRTHNQWGLQAELALDQVDIDYRHLSASVYELGMALSVKKNQLTGLGALTLDRQQSPLKYTFAYNLNSTVGQADATINSFRPAKSELINQLIATTGLPLALKSGEIDLALDANWDADGFPQVSVNLLAGEVSGDYAQNQFTNMSVDVHLSGSAQQWRLEKPAKFAFDEINIGVPISEVSFDFNRAEKADNEKAVIELNEFSAQALDGSIYGENITFDLNQPVNEFSVYLFNLSLEKLLALNKTEDLIASGYFDGELPIRLENDQLSIKQGWIKADESGGVIKYDRIDEVLIGDPNLELVAGLLKDFRYNEMSAKIDLQPDGKLLLGTKLHGRSPNAELNKQVNLNFNIEFNLWKFLESARLLTRIDQDVSEQIISRQRDK